MMELTVVKDGYGLKAGTTFKVKRLTLIVDENGTGKSTLLAGIAKSLGWDEDYRIDTYKGIVQNGLNDTYKVGYFSDLVNKKHASSMSGSGDILEVIQAIRASSGESTKGQIFSLFKDNLIIILDEPCSHLDMYSVRVIAEAIKLSRSLFIIVEHNKQFLDLMVEHNEKVEAYNVRGDSFVLKDYIEEQTTREIK